MHVIPSLIPEAVLGTKEPSEKARTAAFEVILAMGRKMSEGGVVKRSLIDGMDEDGDGVVAQDGLYIYAAFAFDTFLIDFFILLSCGERGGVHDHGSWWSRRCKPPYDQCDGDGHLPSRIRIQRFASSFSFLRVLS